MREGTFSIFDLFRPSIGPSSSHTAGPMRAARMFVEELAATCALDRISRIRIDLFGSLALTGKGHGTDRAIVAGLQGLGPETADTEDISAANERLVESGFIILSGDAPLAFDAEKDIIFHTSQRLPFHPNGMGFGAWIDQKVALARTYYSVGGGAIVSEEEADNGARRGDTKAGRARAIPFPFRTAAELLELCERDSISVAEVMFANECVFRDGDGVKADIAELWSQMRACIERGLKADGLLPGALRVKRRAPELLERFNARRVTDPDDPLQALDRVNLWAIAVNEENAAGGRIVTAPTNGAAGIIPAVLKYLISFHKSGEQDVRDFFLTAGAIGLLYKENASISGAEVGCQGEVGVACSMAAAGLTAVLGGDMRRIENAAEIAMEHNLSLTCDPVGGLVQIPCIERNAVGAVKAIEASRLALAGDGCHVVSLDSVIETMLQTGRDMQEKYKETSKGGLAVNVIEC